MADSSTLEISWTSIFKVLVALALVWIWLRIWDLAMVMLISIVIAVAVDPVVRWLERRRVPRWLGSSASILLLAGAIILLVLAGWNSISAQGRLIIEGLSDLTDRLRHAFPALDRIFPGSAASESSRLNQWALSVATSAMRALALVTIGMIITVYLLIEWKLTLEWVVAFVPREHRARVRRTLREAKEIVSAYVAGNVVTSVFAAAFVFMSLTILKVPAALLLSLLAGVFDFVPVLGFVVSGLPAVMLFASVSAPTAVLVAGLYVTYHFIENYFIGPKVYGDQLRLSNLAVLVSFAVGAELAGVTGALLALPIAATYPAIERIWLADRLSEDTVEKHQKLETGSS